MCLGYGGLAGRPRRLPTLGEVGVELSDRFHGDPVLQADQVPHGPGERFPSKSPRTPAARRAGPRWRGPRHRRSRSCLPSRSRARRHCSARERRPPAQCRPRTWRALSSAVSRIARSARRFPPTSQRRFRRSLLARPPETAVRPFASRAGSCGHLRPAKRCQGNLLSRRFPYRLLRQWAKSVVAVSVHCSGSRPRCTVSFACRLQPMRREGNPVAPLIV